MTEPNKNLKKEKVTSVVTFRLNSDQLRLLDLQAAELGLERATFCRKVVVEYLKGSDANLINAALLNLQKKQKDLDTKLEFLEQLFETFLQNYLTHTIDIPDSEKQIAAANGKAKFEMFINSFYSNLYNQNVSLFDRLNARLQENTNDK